MVSLVYYISGHGFGHAVRSAEVVRALGRGWPEYCWLIDWLREAYGQADVLLRLPFHGDLSAFHAIEDVPLVSRPASAPRAVLRQRLGLGEAERAVLLTFGGLGLAGLDAASLADHARYTFIATEKE